MRLINLVCTFATLVATCLALQARDAHLTFPNSSKRGIMIGKINNELQEMEQPVVIDSSTNKLEFTFAIASSERPSQVALLLGIPERDLEVVLEPQVTDNGELIMYRFKIDKTTIPKPLLYFAQYDKELLTVSVILANPDNYKDNVLSVPFKIQVDLEDVVDYKRPARFEPKPEIIHQFNPEPQTVPWKLAQLFIFLITLVTLGLVIAWMSSGSFNFNNVPTNFNIVYLLFFICSVIGFEYIFVQYYAGKSIFETLFAALYLGVPSLWLGTKFLRNFGETI